MSFKVLVTKYVPEEGMTELKKYCQVLMPEEGSSFTDQEIMEMAAEVDAIIVVRYKVTAALIKKAKKLKIISNYGVGYDNVDLEAATARKIPVTNLPDTVTEATAELAFTLMLALSRRIIEADNYVRNQNDGNWHPLLLISNELYQKKLGIIGFGRIGRAVARRALAFGMEVYFYDPALDHNSQVDVEAGYLSFDDLLEEVDYISLHVPYLEKTHHLIGTDELVKMKKSSFLVNASRGPIVDQKALIEALNNEEIAGAALDVYETEPEVPEELTVLSNVVLTPHLGTTTVETKTRMAREAAARVIQLLEGEKPSNIVNLK